MTANKNSDPLQSLLQFIGDHSFALNDRLPPERELCVQLGTTRAALRKAMAVLESEGQVWRHVGRGTFIGARPVLNLDEVKYLSSITTPLQILDARVAIEPELARLAALHATASNFSELLLCVQRCRDAESWRVFEAWDSRFHYAIASATKNKLLGALFETLNALRRSVVWQTIRAGASPSPNHPSFAEHHRIYDAIVRREPALAAESMQRHLASVRSRLIIPKVRDHQPEAGKTPAL